MAAKGGPVYTIAVNSSFNPAGFLSAGAHSKRLSVSLMGPNGAITLFDHKFRGAKNAIQQFGGAVNTILNPMKALGAYLGIRALSTFTAGIRDLGKSVIDTAATFDRMQMALDVLTKGQGDVWFQKLNQWALWMPMSTKEAVQAFQTLRAYGLNPTIDQMTTIIDQVMALNLGAEGLGRVALALGQIQAKGRLMGQEILQLTNQGIPAVRILADKLKKSPGDIMQGGRGYLPANKVIPALLEGMKERVGGYAVRMQDTYFGLIETIKSYGIEFARVLGMEGGMLDTIEEKLRNVRDWMERFQSSGELNKWAKHAGESFDHVVEKIEMYIGVVQKAIEIDYGSLFGGPGALLTTVADGLAAVAKGWELIIQEIDISLDAIKSRESQDLLSKVFNTSSIIEQIRALQDELAHIPPAAPKWEEPGVGKLGEEQDQSDKKRAELEKLISDLKDKAGPALFAGIIEEAARRGFTPSFLNKTMPDPVRKRELAYWLNLYRIVATKQEENIKQLENGAVEAERNIKTYADAMGYVNEKVVELNALVAKMRLQEIEEKGTTNFWGLRGQPPPQKEKEPRVTKGPDAFYGLLGHPPPPKEEKPREVKGPEAYLGLLGQSPSITQKEIEKEQQKMLFLSQKKELESEILRREHVAELLKKEEGQLDRLDGILRGLGMEPPPRERILYPEGRPEGVSPKTPYYQTLASPPLEPFNNAEFKKMTLEAEERAGKEFLPYGMSVIEEDRKKAQEAYKAYQEESRRDAEETKRKYELFNRAVGSFSDSAYETGKGFVEWSKATGALTEKQIEAAEAKLKLGRSEADMMKEYTHESGLNLRLMFAVKEKAQTGYEILDQIIKENKGLIGREEALKIAKDERGIRFGDKPGTGKLGAPILDLSQMVFVPTQRAMYAKEPYQKGKELTGKESLAELKQTAELAATVYKKSIQEVNFGAVFADNIRQGDEQVRTVWGNTLRKMQTTIPIDWDKTNTDFETFLLHVDSSLKKMLKEGGFRPGQIEKVLLPEAEKSLYENYEKAIEERKRFLDKMYDLKKQSVGEMSRLERLESETFEQYQKRKYGARETVEESTYTDQLNNLKKDREYLEKARRENASLKEKKLLELVTEPKGEGGKRTYEELNNLYKLEENLDAAERLIKESEEAIVSVHKSATERRIRDQRLEYMERMRGTKEYYDFVMKEAQREEKMTPRELLGFGAEKKRELAEGQFEQGDVFGGIKSSFSAGIDELSFQVSDFGSMGTEAVNGIYEAFGELNSGIVDCILETGKLNDAFASMGRMVLNTLMEIIMKELTMLMIKQAIAAGKSIISMAGFGGGGGDVSVGPGTSGFHSDIGTYPATGWHMGGIPGEDRPTKLFHAGTDGLKTDEVFAVLQKGEAVISKSGVQKNERVVREILSGKMVDKEFTSNDLTSVRRFHEGSFVKSVEKFHDGGVVEKFHDGGVVKKFHEGGIASSTADVASLSERLKSLTTYSENFGGGVRFAPQVGTAGPSGSEFLGLDKTPQVTTEVNIVNQSDSNLRVSKTRRRKDSKKEVLDVFLEALNTDMGYNDKVSRTLRR